jgi:hypothetical protein
MQTFSLGVYGSNRGWSIDYPDRCFEVFLSLARKIPGWFADVLSFCVEGAAYLLEFTLI